MDRDDPTYKGQAGDNPFPGPFSDRALERIQ